MLGRRRRLLQALASSSSSSSSSTWSLPSSHLHHSSVSCYESRYVPAHPYSRQLRGFSAANRSQNLIEKIVEQHTDPDQKLSVSSGAILHITPHHIMTHDNTFAVMSKFATLGEGRLLQVANPQQPVLALDHNVQDRSAKNIARYQAIESFASQQGIDFYPAGRGIGHQVMCEEGYVQPGWMVVASDSHSNMYGALGALGTPVVRTDAAGIWATGSTWWRVPPVAQISLEGQLRPGVTGKDVILALCGYFDQDEVLNHAIEFSGSGLKHLSIEDRMTISNMTTEWGALAGVFPVDDITTEWLLERASVLRQRWGIRNEKSSLRRIATSEGLAKEAAEGIRLEADSNARYAKKMTLDLSSFCPLVAGPNEIKRVLPVHQIETQKIGVQKAYIVSCVNSRVDDLGAAAHVLRGKKVANGVELYIAAASSEVEKESKRRGDWQVLVDAGAIELPSGCGPCVGLGRGLLKDGEVAISATNRNFKGRMGSRQSQAYLSSPTVVAQSAALGYISAPESAFWLKAEGGATKEVIASCRIDDHVHETSAEAVEENHEQQIDIIPGFPPHLEGQVLFCPSPNIDTDGIYAGRHCYEDLDFASQAKVAMENYDPRFASLVKQGDVLIAGPNFGCGSSREQAATALRACGVAVIIVSSANETFRRNALNNAMLVIECPQLYQDLLGHHHHLLQTGDRLPTTLRTKAVLHLDFARSIAQIKGIINEEQKQYSVLPVGRVAQEIIVAGGLEGWVRQKMKEQKGSGEGGGVGGDSSSGWTAVSSEHEAARSKQDVRHQL